MNEIKNNHIYLLRRYPKILAYNTFLILFLIVTIIWLWVYKYDKYYNTYGIIRESNNNYLLEINIPIDIMENITKHRTLKKDDKEYKFEIVEIDEHLYFDEQLGNFQKIVLNIPFKEEMINNLVVNVKLKVESKPIINYFKNLF